VRSSRDSSSRSAVTPLVDLFVRRSGIASTSAWRVMEELVERLRREAASSSALSLERFLKVRNVIEKRVDPEITCDGFIEPIGAEFVKGFRLVLNGNRPSVRQRFTIAHEICHTFFYEIVPELKFRSHPTDSYEEALCNHGAAALLMPAEDVIANSRAKDISIATLEDLGRRYEVSIEAAFLRLRALRLWDCELTVWHRMKSGAFVVDRIHSWLKADWRWVNTSVPDRAWSSKSPIVGRAFVYYDATDGYCVAKPIFFQVARKGESLIAIWGRKPLSSAKRLPTLFEKPELTRPRRRGMPLH